MLLSVFVPFNAAAQDDNTEQKVPERDSNLEFMTSKGWEWELNAGLEHRRCRPWHAA